VNLTVESISNVDRGIHGPKFNNLEKFANVLNVQVKELFEFPDET
jgi:transcriptional regulator with XRE-family HTH domain